MNSEPSGVPLRRRVLVSILAVTTLAVILFALPLGVAVQRLYRSEAVTALQRDAARAAAVVPDTIPGGPVNLPRQSSSQPVIGVYDMAGQRVAGSGPARSVLAVSGPKAQVRDAVEGGDLAVITPIPSDQKAVGTVRAAVPYRTVTDRVHRAWAVMALLALIATGLAAVLARRQSVRLSAPLERLTRVARALGDGDFMVRAERSGLREADTASQALEDTAAQLGDLLDRERAFSSEPRGARTDERSPKPVVTPYTTVPSATIASTVSRPRVRRARASADSGAGAPPRATLRRSRRRSTSSCSTW